MRAFVTLLLAFGLSLLAGATAATQIAVMTQAREEFILVFMLVAVIAALASAAFAVAMIRGDVPRRVAWTGRALVALLAILVMALAGFAYWAARGSFEAAQRDLPILLGVAGPSLAVVLVQWLIVGWRTRAAATQS